MSRAALLGLVALLGLLAGLAVAGSEVEASYRPSEPIVIAGALLAPFDGADLGELRVWSWSDGQWRMLPFQIDERNADGFYRSSEDHALDENDELVFMAQARSLPSG